MENFRNITQAYSQAPWRNQLKFIGLFLLLVVFIALVAGIYLDVTARAATMGREILIMQKEIDLLELEIADTKTQLAYVTSSTEMENRALSLGFQPVEIDQAMYLVVTTLQIIPQFQNKAGEILNAQQARGLETQGNFLKRLRALFPVVVPMILGSLIDIDERAIALESRAFSKPGPKTSLIEIPDSEFQKFLRWSLILIGLILIVWRLL